MMTRRQAIKTTVLATATIAAATGATAQSVIDGKFQPLFKLPPLPYAFDALEPFVDARTMEIHHDKHHAAYVANLNKAIAEMPDFYLTVKNKGLTENSGEGLLKDLNSVPEKVRTAVRNNGGGHYNHSLFWQMMKKNGSGEPKGELADAINKHFGSFNGFKEQLTKAALGQFGSGWAWLTIDSGALKIEASPNQDNSVSLGRPVLLGIDVWEHAYYLKYQNKRADYIAAWFNVVDWDFAAGRYAKLKV
jgi:superoxide dismutase, Fe-Mn family